MRRPNVKRPLLWLIVIGTLLVEGGCVTAFRGNLSTRILDFAALYGAGQSVHQGAAPVYDPSQIRGVDRILGHETRPIPASRVDTLHPPFEALLFLPFSLLPFSKAYYAWTACSLAFLWLVPLVLWKFIPRLHAEFEIIAVLYGLSLPVLVCLIEGQDSILLLLLLTLSFASLADGHEMRAGAILVLGLFKFHLVLPFVAALFVARRWKAVAGFVLGFVPLLLVTFAVVGTRATLSYFPYVLHFSHHISVNASEKTPMMPNLRGLVSFLSGSLIDAGQQSIIVVCVSAALFLLLLLWIAKFPDLPIAVRFSGALVVTSLISYHYYVHNAAILILPLLLMANQFAAPAADQLLRRIFVVCVTAICATMIVASVGLVLLENAMPILATESLVLAGVIFAIPFREPKSVTDPAPATLQAYN